MFKLIGLFSKVNSWMSGRKTHLVGLAMCFSGLAGMAGSLANMSDISGILGLFQGTDPGLQLFLQGCAVMTGRAAIAKAIAPESK